MYSQKWFIFLFMAWAVGGLLSAMSEMIYFDNTQMSALEVLLTFGTVQIPVPLIGTLTVPFMDSQWVSVVGSMFLWDYSFFKGDYGQMIRFVFLAMTAGIVVPLLIEGLHLIRGG